VGIVERVEPIILPPGGWAELRVVDARPGDEFEAVLRLRRRVFGLEQGMVAAAVTDKDDARSVNALALRPDGRALQPVGTGRLTPNFGEQGEALVAWVATAPEARERGVGTAVMRFLLAAADEAGIGRVVLAAQLHAEAFYRRFGFLPAGRIYGVRGVRHRWMARG